MGRKIKRILLTIFAIDSVHAAFFKLFVSAHILVERRN